MNRVAQVKNEQYIMKKQYSYVTIPQEKEEKETEEFSLEENISHKQKQTPHTQDRII